MATRIVEGKKPYTGGKAITVDENKVISLNLREENNLIIYDAGDDEIYVDLQLPDGITPLDAFPVGITVGRVLVADDWDVTGTLACFKTTSGDNIKLLYGDNGKVYIDNGTGLFKQIYLKGEVDALLQALRDYVDAQLALKQDKLIAGDYIEINDNVISAVIPTMSRFLSIWNASSGEPISFPASTPFLYTTGDYYLIEGVGVSDNYRPAPIEYDGSASTIPETDEVADGDVYIYDGAVWLLQSNHGKTVTFQNIAGDPYDNTNLATALNAKQNTLVSGTNIKSINNNSLLGSGDLSIAEVPSGGTNGQVLTQTSQGPSWQNATGGADIVYATQTEYNNLPSSKLTDGKHYVIYTSDSPTPPAPWQPGVNTLVYYNINDNDTNSTIYDLSGNGVDQTWYGTPGYTTDSTYGRVATFNGSNYTSSGSIVDFGGECTFIALVNLNDFYGGIVIECASSTSYGVGLACGWDTNNVLNGWYSGILDGSAHIESTPIVSANQRVMVASTRASDGTAKIYINGILDNTVTGMNNPTYTSPENLSIGKRRLNNNYLNGQFKLFIGENRTWTDREIADLAREYGFTVS